MSDRSDVTGETLREAGFDRTVSCYLRWAGSAWLVVTVVGIPLIPLWLLFSICYAPAYVRRLSARLTSHAVEVKKGVFFRSEVTIPLNRITDIRLYDGPLMRAHKLRGLRVETAGQTTENASEGKLIGVIDVVEFRNAVLLQRQSAFDVEQTGDSGKAQGSTELLAEIRDILVRMEKRQDR